MKKADRLAHHAAMQGAVPLVKAKSLSPKKATRLFDRIQGSFKLCLGDLQAARKSARLRAKDGVPLPIYWGGRAHTPMKLFGRPGLPHRDVTAFAEYKATGEHSVYRFGKGATKRWVNWVKYSPEPGTCPPYNLDLLPTVGNRSLVDIIQERTGERPNHCIVTRYVNDKDCINLHHDKVVDLEPGTGIHMLSLGAPRTLTIAQQDDKQTVFKVPTEHGGLVTLTWEDNLAYKHGIHGNSKQTSPRISLIFRTCRTWYNPETGASRNSH